MSNLCRVERENEKSAHRIHELRKAYCYLAEKMQAKRLLPDMDLISYLTHQEIDIILDDRKPK